MPQAAGADDDHGCPWWQVGDGLLYGSVRREPTVRQADGVCRRTRRAELYQGSSVRCHEIGKAAVDHRASEFEPLAELVVTPTARSAEAARDIRMGDHGIADLKVDDCGAKAVDPAGHLVAKHVRQGRRQIREHAVDNVQVRPTQACASDADDDVEWPTHHRVGDVLDDRELTVGMEPRCFHQPVPGMFRARPPRRRRCLGPGPRSRR